METLAPGPCDVYRGRRVAVLAASGFIGRWVAGALAAREAEVWLVVRHGERAETVCQEFNLQGRIIELDLLDFQAATRWFLNARPSVTFNLAGYGVDRSERDEKTAFRTNAQLVQVVCRAVAAARDPDWRGQNIVHVGSALEYGTIHTDLREDSLARPTTLYGRSKLAGTHLFRRALANQRTKGVVARLFTVYGPGEHQGRLLPSLLEAARTGEPVRLTAGMQKRDFTYVEDVAEGLLRLGLSEARPGEIVNLATGKLVSVRSFAETAAGVLRIPPERLLFGSLPGQNGEMEHAEVTIERLQRLTGWVPPTGVAEGIHKTLSHLSKPEPCPAIS